MRDLNSGGDREARWIRPVYSLAHICHRGHSPLMSGVAYPDERTAVNATPAASLRTSVHDEGRAAMEGRHALSHLENKAGAGRLG